jgi:phosphatidylglycerol---prolipoprotein diacylglyceryl transferase
MALIPYFSLPTIDLGPLSLQPFGILVATGVLVGAYVARKRAETLQIDEDHLRSLIGWVLVTGFIGAHVFDVLAYQRDKLAEDPLLLIKLWAGISSYGGFLGALIGFFVYTRKIGKIPVTPYADVIVWGGLVGFTFGRLGCAVVHDHLGRPAGDFFLAIDIPPEVAMQFPSVTQPGPHHDLGLYELIYLALFVIPVTFALTRKVKLVGLNLAIVSITYAAVRPFLDYFRFTETDPRYLGLTFAQWMSIVTMVAGIYVAVYLKRHGKSDKEWAAELAALPPKERRAPEKKPAPKSDKPRVPAAKAKSPAPASKKKKKKK